MTFAFAVTVRLPLLPNTLLVEEVVPDCETSTLVLYSEQPHFPIHQRSNRTLAVSLIPYESSPISLVLA